ncbi:MAG: hypoxanthine phosphoribosyltransferase [Aeriscardovia sp.]|nr:hypoxanthine phosphoribosyltransferase [Aeriscardovia sp.]
MEVSDVQNYDDIEVERVLLTHEQIEAKLEEVARKIDEDYRGKDLLMVAVLKGAINTMVGLNSHMHSTAEMDFMSLSSYGVGMRESTGTVTVRADLTARIKDRDILIVEDVVDSGYTLHWLANNLKQRGARSVEVFPLLTKPSRRKYDIDIKYPGYEIPDEFVVGFGLDYDERYRNLDSIVVVKPQQGDQA